MFKLRITERRKKKHRGLCANLRCLSPLEPPFNWYAFEIDGSPRIFKRAFCVDCHEKLTTLPARDLWFEVQQT